MPLGMKKALTVKLPDSLEMLDLNKLLFKENGSFSPNENCLIIRLSNHPLKEYLKDFSGKKILIIIEEIEGDQNGF